MALSFTMTVAIGFFGGILSSVLVAMVIRMINNRWNVPVIILRYTGDKRRPMLVMKKARKEVGKGGVKLYVRGYELPVKDFKSENYYPVEGTKYGGIVLWEVDDGVLTPVIPRKVMKDEATRKELNNAVALLNNSKVINFEFDEQLYNDIKLKAVDDTDIEWAIGEFLRIDRQYSSGGIKEFLQQYAVFIVIIIIAALLLVGFIIWLKQQPEMAAACASTCVNAMQSTAEKAANAIPLA